jgi:hypothetical protein
MTTIFIFLFICFFCCFLLIANRKGSVSLLLKNIADSRGFELFASGELEALIFLDRPDVIVSGNIHPLWLAMICYLFLKFLNAHISEKQKISENLAASLAL